MYTDKVRLEQQLLQTEIILRNACTPKPYKLNLEVSFYYAGGEDYWKEYLDLHPDVIVRFFDEDETYYDLKDGKLVKSPSK